MRAGRCAWGHAVPVPCQGQCVTAGGHDPHHHRRECVAGLLNPAFFLGGEIALDIEASRAAFSSAVPGPWA